MRLQKYLALCGVASRRAAEKMIADGHVTVDGVTVTEMGVSVEETQAVCVDGAPVKPETRKYYLMYHKPAGEVTTVSDPEGRATVLDRFDEQVFEEVLFAAILGVVEVGRDSHFGFRFWYLSNTRKVPARRR